MYVCMPLAVQARGWRTLTVVAPPFHLPRAAMTAASVASKDRATPEQ